MSRLSQFLLPIIAIITLGLMAISLSAYTPHPVTPSTKAIDKSKMKDAVTDLKISTMKINHLIDNIDKQVQQSSTTLDRQKHLLESSQNQQDSGDRHGIESDFTQWQSDYVKLIELEGYYMLRSNKRVDHLVNSHHKSMSYIDSILLHNNELFNLFTPLRSQSLIQQNEILNFKLSLQKRRN